MGPKGEGKCSQSWVAQNSGLSGRLSRVAFPLRFSNS